MKHEQQQDPFSHIQMDRICEEIREKIRRDGPWASIRASAPSPKDMKVCKRCDRLLRLTEYSINKRNPNGTTSLRSMCKKCYNEVHAGR